jgi:AcrR family transcriptional regulator
VRPRLVSDDQLLTLILDAFAELGYEGVSLRALCRDLGLSHNVLNERFGSKERMWYAAVDHGFGELIAMLQQLAVRLQRTPGSADLETLRTVIVEYLRAAREHPSLQRLVNQEAARPGPRWDYMFENYIEPIHRQAEVTINRLIADGVLRADAIAPVYYFIVSHGLGALATLPAVSRRLGDADPDTTLSLAVDVLLRGLSARPEDPLGR